MNCDTIVTNSASPITLGEHKKEMLEQANKRTYYSEMIKTLVDVAYLLEDAIPFYRDSDPNEKDYEYMLSAQWEAWCMLDHMVKRTCQDGQDRQWQCKFE